MMSDRIFIFPNLGDELPELITSVHSKSLLVSYQILVDGGVFASIVVNEVPIELAAKLYSSVYSKLNIKPHHQTGGIELTKHEP